MNLKFFLPAVLISVAFSGCDDESEERSLPASVVSFPATSLEITENSDSQTVSISFSSKASANGEIILGFDQVVTDRLNITPSPSAGNIVLPVTKGDTQVAFTIRANDNDDLEEDWEVAFNIESVSDGLQVGNSKTINVTIKDDERLRTSTVNFTSAELSFSENDNTWKEIFIELSEPAVADATIQVEYSGTAVLGDHFVTEPAFNGNTLTLTTAKGSTKAFIKVKPIDDDLFFGHLDLAFRIVHATGTLTVGSNNQKHVSIADDELKSKFKGYSIGGGSWTMKKYYEYTLTGNIGKVHWETNTPYHRSGTDIYYYDAGNQVTHIEKGNGEIVNFTYEGSSIVKEEQHIDGVLKKYIDYAYDDAGNVGAYQVFYLQPDGSFALSSTTVLLYFTDGNLYKKLVYVPSQDPENPYLSSTETFEDYLENENPSPMVELLPNIKTQKNLPSRYRYEVPGHDLQYELTYQFNTSGKVISRTAELGTTTEFATYEYY